MYNYILGPIDTDSISLCKPDMTPFTVKEQEKILEELNKLTGTNITWKHDGIYDTVIVLKAKNYILFDGTTIKTKGSALRDQKVEAAIRVMKDKIIEYMIKDATPQMYIDLYNCYIKEAMNVLEIKRWSSKKTLTEKVETSERANETKLKDAVAGSEYRQSDKVWVFFKEDDTLCLAENFTGDYNRKRLLQKLFKSVQVFKNVLPVKDLFPNYSLKKNSKILETLISINKEKVS